MKKLFIDIETAPNLVYTWGLFNQNVGLEQIVAPGYTLCWAAQWDHEKKVIFSSKYHDGEEAMLKGIYHLLDEADVVIHYNGRRFDVPILNKDFVRHHLPPPDSYSQIDLLQTVRSRFRFASNKLDFVSQFLGLDAKYEHKGMQLWTGCMAGEEKSWNIMKKYNIQDVKMLPKFYKQILPWIQDHPNEGLYIDEDVQVCTNCGSDDIKMNGVERLSTQTYQRYRCNNCGTPLRGRSTILSPAKRKTILTSSKL